MSSFTSLVAGLEGFRDASRRALNTYIRGWYSDSLPTIVLLHQAFSGFVLVSCYHVS